MPGQSRRRLRQAATLVVFVIGIVATVATSPASTSVEIPAKSATVRLDPEHPASLTRVVVRVNAEATSGSPFYQVHLRARTLQPGASSNVSPGPAAKVRFIVTSATLGVVPVPEGSPSVDAQPVPTPWQTEVSGATEVQLPLMCGIGPCERAFWMIAQLTDENGDAVDVEWSIRGSMRYSGLAWPSGAAADIEIAAPIPVAAPVPQLAVSTETETLTLGPSQPAAARVIEVRIGPGAIPEDGSGLAVLSVDFIGEPAWPPPAVAVYPLDGPDAVSPVPDASAMPTAPPGGDPFAGCEPGAPCARRFLVTMAWTGSDQEQTVDWRLTVRRVDLVRAWSTPAELSAQVQRRFDVAPGSESTIHHEGEANAAGPVPPPQVQLVVRTQTTATDPLVALLPVPAVLSYRAEILEPRPPPSAGGPSVESKIIRPIAQAGSVTPAVARFVDGNAEVVASGMANQSGVCRVGEVCRDLTITTSVTYGGQTASTLPTVRFRWSLDLTVYSYTDVPISLSLDAP